MSDSETSHDVLEKHWSDEGEPRGALSALEEDYYVRRPDDNEWFIVTEVVKLPGWAVAVVCPPSSGDVDDVAAIKGGGLREYPILDHNLNDPLETAHV